MRAEDDLTSRAREYESVQVEIGTVGWDGHTEWYEKGTGDNDGHTLVYVTLYRGKDPNVRPEKGTAHGLPILCHIADGIYRIPKKGTRCYVLMPRGMEDAPGAGVIVACVSPSPTVQFEDDRVVMDFGADTHVVVRGKSVSLSDPANRFLSVGSPRSGGDPGLIFQAEDGSGGVIQRGVVSWFVAAGGQAKTIIQMTPEKVECCTMGGGFWKLDADFHVVASSAKIQSGGVYLGLLPANPALWGVTGIAGVASTSVFISI